MRHRTVWLVIATAIASTVLNALKPPVIDDSAYLAYARHFLAQPDSPYAFDHYGNWANSYLVPPVLPAWLAVGMAAFGDDPVALKLWLFPILLLFTASLAVLLRRFAPALQSPLLLFTVFSPPILPSINLMLDVPVLAFGLAAIALYLHAFERQSLGKAIAAGLLAGVAMETKYTAFTLPALFLGHGLLYQSWRFAAPAALVAVAAFAGCEGWIAYVHGDSHFLLAMHGREQNQRIVHMLHLLAALIGLAGGLASVLWLIGLAVLGFSRRIIFVFLALIAAGYGLLAAVPIPFDVFVRYPDSDRPLLVLNNLLFPPVGIFVLATAAIVAVRVRRSKLPPGDEQQRDNRFVVLWLLIEVSGYFAISPFPAVRRLLGMFIAATVLTGRLAVIQRLDVERRRLISQLAGAGVLLGLGYYLIEVRDAVAERDAFVRALEFVRGQEGKAPIRFHGTWGFMAHAEMAHLKWTRNVGEDLQPGDWFIHDPRDGIRIWPGALPHLKLIATFAEEDGLPLATQPTFYASRAPIVHFEGPRMEVFVYRYLPDYSRGNQ